MASFPPVPPQPLLLLDYDGTLAPIVDDPARAFPHSEAAEILKRLASEYPLYVISGRDLETLAGLLSVSVPAVGLHGAQEGVLTESYKLRTTPEEENALADMKRSAPDFPGVFVEDKGTAFAVHFRKVDDEEHVVSMLDAWASTAPVSLAAVWGKKVVELRAASHSKGTAVAELAAEHPQATPVYIGDDTTDEDAFEALHALAGAQGQEAVTIKVGEGETIARFKLDSPDEVVGYLREFLS